MPRRLRETIGASGSNRTVDSPSKRRPRSRWACVAGRGWRRDRPRAATPRP